VPLQYAGINGPLTRTSGRTCSDDLEPQHSTQRAKPRVISPRLEKSLRTQGARLYACPLIPLRRSRTGFDEMLASASNSHRCCVQSLAENFYLPVAPLLLEYFRDEGVAM
jgi:hypothetical protein